MDMIYFWNIAKLKSELINKPLSGWQALIYFICIFCIQIVPWVLAYTADVNFNLWDNIDTAVFFIFLVIGTVYCFYANSGRSGKDFISRYVSLSWVFGVRYTIMVVIPAGVFLYLIPSLFIDLPENTRWHDVLFNAILKFPFYVILARHIRDVALKRVPSEKEISGFRDEHPEDFDQSKHPTILRRYLATFIDMVIVLSAFIFLAYVFQGKSGGDSRIMLWIGVAFLLSYEPVLTSRICTIGQRITGISIRNLESRGRISILDAYLRTIVKLLLGIVSFFSIPITRKRRALHDFVARSVVVYAEHTLH